MKQFVTIVFSLILPAPMIGASARSATIKILLPES